VWSGRKLEEKLEYMHATPLKRKLVVHAQDRPWSSWAHYAKGEGLIHIDQVGEEREPVGKRAASKKKRQNLHP
jgi:hypothetical protein